MISSVATAFSVSIFVFISLIFLVQKERQRGRRFFASDARGWLDKMFDRIGKSLVDNWNHFARYIVQLNWYYGIHSFLKTLLRVIVAFYTYFENMFERNRSRTKQLRFEKRELNELNHLNQMAKHRKDTALTPAQKRKLKQKELEGKH